MSSPPLPVGTTAAVHPWRQRLRLFLGAAAAVGLLWLAFHAAGGPAEALALLGRASPGWLGLAVAAQWLSYEASAARLRRLVAEAVPLARGTSLGLELAMNGLWVLAPAAPAEALAYGAGELRRRGLDRARTGLVLALEQWFTFRVLSLVAALNLLVVLLTRDFPVGGPWPPLAAVGVLVALAWTAVLVRRPSSMERLSRAWARVRFWAPRPSEEEHRAYGEQLHRTAWELLGGAGNRARLVLLSLASHLLGVLSLLLCLRAVGVSVDPDVVLLASALALLVSSVPLLPAGLGTVEVAVPALLHWYGAPLAPALAGALVARVVGTLLPALAGAVALLALRAGVALPASAR